MDPLVYRIGLVLPNTPAYSETFFRSKIRGLRAAGHEVVVFAGKRSESRNVEGARVMVSPPVWRRTLVQLLWMAGVLGILCMRAPRRVKRFIQLERQSGHSWRHSLENLYLNSHILPQQLDWLHFGFATMALRRENVAKAIGAKMAISFRGYDICIYPIQHPGCYELLWKRVDKIHTISDDLLMAARKQGLPYEVPVQKISPAIDVMKFSSSMLPPPSFKGPIRFLTIARLHWKKGLDYTLDALGLLQTQGVDFRYRIIGDGPEYERLLFAAHQLGLADRVEFAGRQSHELVREAMEEADIYLQYSIQEGFCNAALEAQAMGLLCIVSDAEGLSENVLHGKTGWVVPKRRPDLLAQQILDVLAMPAEKLGRIRQAATGRVQKEFNLHKQQQEFVAFYAR